MLYLRSTGGRADNMWSLVYRGAGFVGSITLVGPDATERGETTRQAGPCVRGQDAGLIYGT